MCVSRSVLGIRIRIHKAPEYGGSGSTTLTEIVNNFNFINYKFKITLQLDPDPQKWLQIDIPVKQSGFVNSWVFKRLNFIFLNVLLGFFDISNSVWRISCSFGGLAIFYLLFSSLPPRPFRNEIATGAWWKKELCFTNFICCFLLPPKSFQHFISFRTKAGSENQCCGAGAAWSRHF